MPPPRASSLAWRLSLAAGWLADRRVPAFLRPVLYGAFCRLTGANAREAELAPRGYPSLGAFFVRRLRADARPIEDEPRALISPCDGLLQALGPIEAGTLLQAKGRRYEARALVDGAAPASALEGGFAWTIYLGPRDYHRVHAPFACELSQVRWVGGSRHSVNPRVLARRERVLAENERAVLRLAGPGGDWFLVLVGALNVGRIRVLGVERGRSPERPLAFGRGAELGRFELGSTVVLIAPPRVALPLSDLYPGRGLRLGRTIGTLVRTEAAAGPLANA